MTVQFVLFLDFQITMKQHTCNLQAMAGKGSIKLVTSWQHKTFFGFNPP